MAPPLVEATSPPLGSAVPQPRLGPHYPPQCLAARCSADPEAWLSTGHPIGLIYGDANEGRKPLSFTCVRVLGLAVNGNIQTTGVPDADERVPGGGGNDRIIICQLPEKQQFSGYWTWSNGAVCFPSVFIGSWGLSLSGGWSECKCSRSCNCLWFFRRSELLRPLTVKHSWALNVCGTLKRPSFKISIRIILL